MAGRRMQGLQRILQWPEPGLMPLNLSLPPRKIFADAMKEWLKKCQELPQPGILMHEDQRAQLEALQVKYRETERTPEGGRKKNTYP
jgi:hypothetical protein